MAKVANSSLSVGTDILNYSRHYVWGLPLIVLLTASAMLLNWKLIVPMGINGSACATLLSYVLYFGLLHGFLWRRMKVCVFSREQLLMLVLAAVLLGLGAAWRLWIGPWMGMGVIADAVLKTVVLGGGAAAAVYRLRLSPTLNGMVLEAIKKLRGAQ
jgi:hypothetical protein